VITEHGDYNAYYVLGCDTVYLLDMYQRFWKNYIPQ